MNTIEKWVEFLDYVQSGILYSNQIKDMKKEIINTSLHILGNREISEEEFTSVYLGTLMFIYKDRYGLSLNSMIGQL